MFRAVLFFVLPLCWTCFGGIVYFEHVLGLFAIFVSKRMDVPT